jgi:hypothetical protein
LDRCYNLRAGDVSPAVGNLIFKQAHDFTGGQVGVKLTGNAEKPGVNTFTGAGRRGH